MEEFEKSKATHIVSNSKVRKLKIYSCTTAALEMDVHDVSCSVAVSLLLIIFNAFCFPDICFFFFRMGIHWEYQPNALHPHGFGLVSRKAALCLQTSLFCDYKYYTAHNSLCLRLSRFFCLRNLLGYWRYRK